jgi:hypothetical protein
MAVYKEDKDCSQYQCPIKGYPIRNDDEAQGQHPNDATDSNRMLLDELASSILALPSWLITYS